MRDPDDGARDAYGGRHRRPGDSRSRRSRRNHALKSGAAFLGPALLLIAGIFWLSAGAASDPPTPAGWITLLHTNDIHGEYAPRPLSRLNGQSTGGFVALAARVASIRRPGGPTLLLDAGDLMTGTPITTLDYHGVPGGAIVELMNRVGYDAMALGNHEFDLGRAACTAAMGRARFPVLCANLADSTGELFTARDGGTLVIERGGVRIGIIGLILDELARVVPRSVIAGLTIRPSIAVAREDVAKLDPVTDLIVILTHQGLDECKELAREVPGIDVIVAGHDHNYTAKPLEQSGVLIVEAGSRCERLGRLDLRVAKDEVAEHRYQLIDLVVNEAEAGGAEVEPVRALVDEMDRQIQADYGQVLAELVTPFERRSRSESNVGDWVADALRQAGGAEFAVTNSSGLRTDVAAGPLTKRELYGVAPFPNMLTTFQASGKDLMDFARSNARKALGREHGESSIVQVSGLSYTFDRKGHVSDLRVLGRPVDPDSLYQGASHDFMVLSQYERYLNFEPRAVQVSTRLVTDVLYAAARAQGRIDARTDGRIRGPVGSPPAPSGKQ